MSKQLSGFGRAELEEIAQRWFALEEAVSARQAILSQAINYFGIVQQLSLAQEECAELVVKISHVHRHRIAREALAEEIADVEIMCEQLRIIIGAHHVDEWKRTKLQRLSDRLVGVKR